MLVCHCCWLMCQPCWHATPAVVFQYTVYMVRVCSIRPGVTRPHLYLWIGVEHGWGELNRTGEYSRRSFTLSDCTWHIVVNFRQTLWTVGGKNFFSLGNKNHLHVPQGNQTALHLILCTAETGFIILLTRASLSGFIILLPRASLSSSSAPSLPTYISEG